MIMNIQRQKIRKGLIFISLLLFPVTFFYFSPYIILFAARAGVVNGSFIVFLALFFFSLFVGRLWCGWLCPGAGLQEACFRFQKKRTSPKVNKIKYVIWVIWLALIAWMAILAGGYKEVDFFMQTKNGISLTDAHSLNMFTIVMVAILVITFLAGRRGFCHTACWMAPFMIIGRKISIWLKIPRLSLAAEKEKCTRCTICTRNCPQSLEVHDMVQAGNMENPECVLCGTCVDSCRRKAIRYVYFKK